MTVVGQNDMHTNFRRYFDMACEGETVVVPGSGNRNVVMISEEAYRALEKARHNAEYLAKLARADEQVRNGQVVVKTLEELEAMAE